MGLRLSILSSTWNGNLRHEFFNLTERVETVLARSISFGSNDAELALKTLSFKIRNHETFNKSGESNKGVNSEKGVLKIVPLGDLHISKDNKGVESSNTIEDHASVNKAKPSDAHASPVSDQAFVFSSPRPITELDAAATKLQKVYKSYRTRRNLADCAVVVEELWWKTLDSAALKQSTTSFFESNKHETAASRWARARTKAAKVGKGLSKDEKAQKLALQHWLEAIDPRHRYGHNLHFYYDVWSDSKSVEPFFYWLDIGAGKEISIESCSRVKLQRDCIRYLAPKEREEFEVIVEEGKLVYKQSGMLLNTTEGSKWIFVLSTSRVLYVGEKKKGVFQHSSFMSGGATTAAGRLVAHDGILKETGPYSGHYLPTEDHFKEFLSFLDEHHVDLTNVKRCGIDQETTSFKAIDEESSKGVVLKAHSETTMSTDNNAIVSEGPVNNAKEAAINADPGNMTINTGNMEALKIDLTKSVSFKWTSGVGPRIGCVRDYPLELQSQALEKVNLSPKLTPSRPRNNLPIPSPRPSPKIRLSPRLANMGLPSPRGC